MTNFLFAVGASVAISVISLLGIFSLLLNEKALDKILLLLVGFGAGGLIGGSFFHLLPESLEHSNHSIAPFIYVIAGFMMFFVLERYLYWRHCHHSQCEIHAFTYLNLVGDGVHNLIDGLILGASFFTDIKLGAITTTAIILHEIPQELGDFGVLVYGGFSKSKALAYNFLSAVMAIVGTMVGYFFSSKIGSFSGVFLPVAAGGFIYIACCDLIPELHKQRDTKKATAAIICFVFGILLMLALKVAH